MFSADLGVNQVVSYPPATDPPFQKVALLLHGDGTNGAQNNTFVDGSSNNFTITRTGNVAQGTFSPFSLAEGQWSNYFDGSGDYLDNTSNYLIASTTSTFTVEAWIYMTAAPTNDAYNIPSMISVNCGGGNNSINYMSFGPISNQKLKLRWFDGAQKGAVGSTTLSLNTWYHVACSVSSNAISIYLNGVAETLTGDTTLTNRSGNANGFALGQTYTYANYSGYISNARVVSGTAVYTANFTPPTSALTAITNTSLLTCQSNRFKDNSSNNFTITRNGDTKVTAFSPFAPSAAYSASTNGGSAYFDGTGDYLTTPYSTSWNFGSGDFTIECWFNSTSSNQYASLISADGSSSAGWSFLLNPTSNDGKVTFYEQNLAGSLLTTSTGGYNDGSWHHVALVRNGTSLVIYIDGVSKASSTTSATTSTPGTLYIGGSVVSGSRALNGYISNARIVKGSAVYTANFTPPTAPLTAVTNTQLLLNCTNAGIIDNAGKNDIETVGNAQISTSVKKYGTGSMYFDGTGDYLLSPSAGTPDLNLSGGDWTIEGWYYPTSYSASNNVIVRLGVSSSDKIVIATIGTSGYLYYLLNGSVVISSTSAGAVNTWSHFALVRSGLTTTLYLNGVSIGTTSSTPTSSNKYIQIGTDAGGALYIGYIDDLRITKGQALYTSNFTPPTQAFPNV